MKHIYIIRSDINSHNSNNFSNDSFTKTYNEIIFHVFICVCRYYPPRSFDIVIINDLTKYVAISIMIIHNILIQQTTFYATSKLVNNKYFFNCLLTLIYNI